jgi:hypothetical protein
VTSTFGCPHCGKSNPIEAKFCAFCGTNLQEVDSETLIPPPEDEEGDALPGPSAQPPQPARHPTRRKPFPWEWAGERAKKRAQDDTGTNAEAGQIEGKNTGEPADEVRERTPEQEPESLTPTTVEWHGLIDPVEPETLAQHLSPTALRRPLTLDDETRRQFRHLYASEVPLDDLPPTSGESGGGGLWRRSWIYWLLLITLTVALLTSDTPPEVYPHVWPGVRAAYEAIEALPDGSVVLVDWAYDPATAGEMDLVARPVVQHLLAQNANLVVMSQLPLGPASARRLIAATGRPVVGEVMMRMLDPSLVEGGFLPGGAATLPLLGQAPPVGLPVDLQGRAARTRAPLAALDVTPPALTIVIATRSDAVQRWLEQVQPLNGVPTLAVVSAAADPVIRPYLDSGQLVGLVGGYSGGMGYQSYMAQPPDRVEQTKFWRQIHGHNWALVLLLFLIVLSNLVPYLARKNE